MIAALAGLLFCQLAGEVLARALALPIPGPVLGLGMLFVLLVVRGRGHDGAVPGPLGDVADAFMRNLSILFIPASVGIVQYLDLLRRFAWPIAVAIVVSTAVTLAATAATFRIVSRILGARAGLSDAPGAEDGA